MSKAVFKDECEYHKKQISYISHNVPRMSNSGLYASNVIPIQYLIFSIALQSNTTTDAILISRL